MKRLNMIVEGQTEETFVRETLGPYLTETNNIVVSVRCVETGRKGGKVYRGGMTSYEKARNDIIRWMKEDAGAWFTTMFDMYALPNNFPGFQTNASNPYCNVRNIEDEFSIDINSATNGGKFIPYIQLHEFEALILSNPAKMNHYFIGPEYQEKIKELSTICSGYDSAELINCGRETAPSKRIISLFPEYEGLKATAGPQIVQQIGMQYFLSHCNHFSEWISKLVKID